MLGSSPLLQEEPPNLSNISTNTTTTTPQEKPSHSSLFYFSNRPFHSTGNRAPPCSCRKTPMNHYQFHFLTPPTHPRYTHYTTLHSQTWLIQKQKSQIQGTFFYVGPPNEDIFSGHLLSPIFQSSITCYNFIGSCLGNCTSLCMSHDPNSGHFVCYSIFCKISEDFRFQLIKEQKSCHYLDLGLKILCTWDQERST